MPDRLEVLLTEEQIRRRVRELAQEIARDHGRKSFILIGILKGAFVFMSDLMRHMNCNVSCDFLGVSSYGALTQSSGIVKITSDLTMPIRNRHVVLVEDILDTGLTLRYLLENLRARSPASLKLCVLLRKDIPETETFHVDYLGFTVPDKFLVGYGLDCRERYRQLPYVAVVHSVSRGGPNVTTPDR